MVHTHWKKLSTKRILDHPRLQVYEDAVELPNGHQSGYIHFGPRRGGATIIAQDKQGRVLVQKEYSYPQDDALLQFPGGGIEAGETPAKAAARELAEEAKLAGHLQQIGWFYPNHRRTSAKMYVFLAIDLHPVKGQAELMEAFEDFWFTPTEINNLIKQNKFVNDAALAAWAFFMNR